MSQKLKRFALVLTMALAMVAGLTAPAFAATNESGAQRGFIWPIWPFDPIWPVEPINEGTVFEEDGNYPQIGSDYTLITEIDGEYYAISVVDDEDGTPHLVVIPIDVFDEDGKPYVVVTDPSMIWNVIPSDNPYLPGMTIDFYNEQTDTLLSDLLSDFGIRPAKIFYRDGKIIVIDAWGRLFYIAVDEDGNLTLSSNKDDAIVFDPFVECPEHPVPTLFTVSFLDADGNPISTKKYLEGTTSDKIKVPADPAKASTDESWFEFAGWDPEIGDVTDNATYTPVFNEWTKAQWKRLGGQNRYGTMALISSEVWDSSDTAILSTGQNFPDALVASSIAGLNNCPIILTKTNSLTQDAADELARLGVKKLHVMGGSAAVSDAVVSEIEAMGITCERIAGDNRQLTSLDALDKIVEAGKYNGTIVVATGANFPDSLSIGPWCAKTSTPIILTNNKGVLTDAEMTKLAGISIKSAVIVGGEAVVSSEVENQLASLGITDITRLAGEDRYETSAAIADWEMQNQGMTRVNLSVATGTNFPDALSGAALCGADNSVILLVRDKMLTAETEEGAALQPLDLINNKAGIKIGYVFGGEAVVSADMMSHLESLTAEPVPVVAE